MIKFKTTELLFTGIGISGIPALEISGRLKGKHGFAEIDFMPDISSEELEKNLTERLAHIPIEQFFTGVFHRLVGQMFMKYVGGGGDAQALTRAIKCFKIPIDGPSGFSEAQVTGGGVRTREFDPHTMESKIQKGLFAAGEIYDIWGDCGGFNLQWAWSSGYIAGIAAL